ncbi:MAG: ABC transporter substrate-binding protein [Dongiaceae bacterium]
MRRIIATFFIAAVGLFPFAGAVTAADRIVSVGGSITEILYALGAGGDIVAADTTSIYPSETADLPKVGYMRALAAEPILALNPGLVIATDDAMPQTVLDQIAAAGVPVSIIVDDPTADGAVYKIRQIAAATDHEAAGAALANEVEAGFRDLAAALEGAEGRPQVLFLLSVGDGAAMAAGQETAADGIISLAGGSNALNGFVGYRPLSPEAAAGLDPALVVVAAHSVETMGGIDAMVARPDLGLIPAVRDGRILVIDANYLLGFGPRSADAARELALQLHPELAATLP